MKKIYLASPHMVGNELKYVKEAFESNWIAPLGPFVNRLEKDICKYVGCKSAVAVASGTAAIHLALIEAGVSKGDVVFCSDMTFTASANPIRYCGATPVFIDSEPHGAGMSPDALTEAFRHYKPKAVVVTSIYGMPAALDEIKAICDEHGVPMIEDSTEVLGATLNGKSAGTFGKFGTYSFNGNKVITTSGGGMLVSNDENCISHALFLATQAKDSSQFYEHSQLGYNYRMSNVSAAIGVGQLEKIDSLIAMKKKIYDKYNNSFEKYARYGIHMMRVPANCTSNYWLSVLMLEGNDFVKPSQIVRILKDIDAEARHVWKPLHTQKLWEGSDFISIADEPYSDYFFEHAVCLPSDTNMTDEEQGIVIDRICNWIDKVLFLYLGE